MPGHVKIEGVQESSTTTFTASASINTALDLLDFTTTEMRVRLHLNLSIASASGIIQDPWDRLIAPFAIVADRNNFYASFDDMVQLHQFNRFAGVGEKRITLPASASSVDYYIEYVLHFGRRPYKMNAQGRLEYDPYDLTAGIPPQAKGQLSVTGTWGAATCMAASGVTINSADFSIRYWGLAPLPGDGASASFFLPKAVPQWSTRSHDNDVGSATSPFSVPEDVPTGDYLCCVMHQTGTKSATTGLLTDRTDTCLNNLRLRDTKQQHDIFSDSSWTALVQEAQENTRGFREAPPGEGAVAGTIATPQLWEPGMYWKDFSRDGSNTDGLYGSPQDGVPTGRLQWQAGAATLSNAAWRILYIKYRMLKNASVQSAVSQPTMAPATPLAAALSVR